MSSEKDNSMNKNHQSDSSNKGKPQQPRDSERTDRSTSDHKSDSQQKKTSVGHQSYSGSQQSASGTQPRFDKPSQPDDRGRKGVGSDHSPSEEIDTDRHPEETVVNPSEFTKRDHTNFSEKSGTV